MLFFFFADHTNIIAYLSKEKLIKGEVKCVARKVYRAIIIACDWNICKSDQCFIVLMNKTVNLQHYTIIIHKNQKNASITEEEMYLYEKIIRQEG